MPCPGCGVTRATLLFLDGRIQEALFLNPNSLFAIIFIITYPVLLMFSILRKHSYIEDCYNNINKMLSRKPVFFLFILFEIAVWVHNVLNHI